MTKALEWVLAVAWFLTWFKAKAGDGWPLGNDFNLSSILFFLGVAIVLIFNAVKLKMERMLFSRKVMLPPRASLAEVRAQYKEAIGDDRLYKLSRFLMPAFLVVGFAWLVAFHFSIS
ncbi:MAG TPA: hypothetical protein VNK82_11825 [Terriglobales bacterium]|nr:hypothetical protein [Terriglobales bacterium]